MAIQGPLLAAGAGLLSSGLGAFGGGGDYYRTTRARINGLFRQLLGEQAAGFSLAEDAYTQALESIRGGFESGKKQLSRYGDASRRGTLEREQQKLGAMDQTLSQSGLYNTTARASGQMGIQGQTDRELQDIDQMLAGLFADLEIGQGQAEAGVWGQIGGLRQNATAANTNLGLNWGNMLYSEGSPALPIQSNPAADFGSALGGFAGLWAGMNKK